MNEDNTFINLVAKYNKILIVDFASGEYRPWKLPQDEKGKPTSIKIADYWNWFINSGLLHPNDVDQFVAFTKEPLAGTHCCYKRKVNGVWREMLMEIVANDDAKTHVLYVRDINDIYFTEIDKAKSIDEMTGCYNQYALSRDIANYVDGNIGVIFADVNGLKVINDTKGHDAGDSLILRFVQKLKDRFSDCKIYRRGGDEFIVIATNVKLRHFASRARAFHKELWRGHHDENEFPIASVGYSVDVECIKEVIDQAEEGMYYDKQMFKHFYPQYKR